MKMLSALAWPLVVVLGLAAGCATGGSAAPDTGLKAPSCSNATGLYYLAGAEMTDGRYHCMVASSPSIKGPYSERYVAVRDAGHATFFQDTHDRWWSTFFGNPPRTPNRNPRHRPHRVQCQWHNSRTNYAVCLPATQAVVCSSLSRL